MRNRKNVETEGTAQVTRDVSAADTGLYQSDSISAVKTVLYYFFFFLTIFSYDIGDHSDHQVLANLEQLHFPSYFSTTYSPSHSHQLPSDSPTVHVFEKWEQTRSQNMTITWSEQLLDVNLCYIFN